MILLARDVGGQHLDIGIIDFYGLSEVSAHDVRKALTIKEGDSVSLESEDRPAFLGESELRVAALPGVARARLNLVCCEAGHAIVYVGIEEKGRKATQFRPAPTGDVRLPADIVQAGKSFDVAITAAVQRGDAAEDDSRGHALSHDPATRATQQRFVDYVARDATTLRRVLRESSDAAHRALAAQVLGYVANKDKAVGDLVYAMRDSSEGVRNNAMRALAVFADAAPSARPTRPIPYDGFVALLGLLVWTDRNKASWALEELSARRDPRLLARLQREAIAPLVEMARWKSPGHAAPALTILGRIAGLSDQAIATASARGEREAIITAALSRQ